MVEDLHVEVIQMMENAGRAVAELAIREFRPRTVTVLAGPGGNGGGGLAAARHLANRGSWVQVVLSKNEEMSPAAARQLDIIRRMGLPVADQPAEADLVVDALIGYSLRGDPKGRVADLIIWANTHSGRLLALDLPSGVDATTGEAATPCIQASVTLTLALPKAGLLQAREKAGRLFLADISVPPLVYQRLGTQVPALFADDTIIEVSGEEISASSPIV